MKNTQLTSILSSKLIACALTIGSLAMTQPASAQYSQTIAVVDIPFTFQTGLQTLPAGTYRIRHDTGSIVVLLGPGKASGYVLTNGATKLHPSDHGTLVFDHLGDKYFLRQIWTAGSTSGLECPMGRAEKQSIVAANKQVATSTQVAINTVSQH
jgi:hypothetical protein